MRIKQDTLITLIIASMLGVCGILLTFMLTLILLSSPAQPSTGATVQGSVLFGIGALLVAAMWFLIKAIAGHLLAHYKKLRRDEEKK